MDRLIYTAMTAAKHTLEQQTSVANNMANAATTGFRAQIDNFRAVPVPGKGLPTRTQVVDETLAADFTQGAIKTTGRNLDIAIDGQGWLAVQAADGSEAYTRAGSLKINPNGILQTQAGKTVIGDNGPITIANDAPIMIGKDGTVSTLVPGVSPAVIEIVGRLKLVNPPADTLKRGDDGLFRTVSKQPAPLDPNVTVASESLEDSNVNVVETMVKMISLSRQFDTQMEMLKNAESNAVKASQILNFN